MSQAGLGFFGRLLLFTREDVQDAVRDRQAHVLVGMFALLGAGLAYAAGRTAQRTSAQVDIELVSQLLAPVTLLIPLVALGVVAPALVEKRSTGSLTVLLGLPFSRQTVVLGTLLGRSIVIAMSALAALLVAVPIALVMGVTIDGTLFAGSLLAFFVLTITFTAIAVAISVVTKTSTRASFAAFSAYVVFVFQLWTVLPQILLYVVSGFTLPETSPPWVDFVVALNPMTAFTNFAGGLVPAFENIPFHAVPDNPAVYEQPLFAFVILLGWIGGPLCFGYLRFRKTDL
ncbi:ABC transporter permease [Natrialba taiwanensis]|uniref:ABC transporter n=1 Tax=Natrialba taiwanensis DSM 12281 TaxID=1230458 RepID=L9ZWB0_9EURY|nr:ABC transporter permease subunit [Natrialba taiwanensis]ELY90775.1 ABC transporter [Natrialba taiwanensis DSM 12281]